MSHSIYFLIFIQVKYRYLFAILLLTTFVSTSKLMADEYADSLKSLLVSLEHKSLTDTVLNTRFELIKYVKDSDYDLFLELAGQNIVLAEKYKKNWALIDVYMEMGEVLISKGIFDGALDHLNKAMSLVENDEYKPYKGWIYIALGNAYSNMFNYGKSLEFYQSALDVFIETDNLEGMGLAATNLGTNYSLLNDPGKAEYYFKKGIDYREKFGNIVELCYTRMYYYEFKIKQGNYLQAESELTALLTYLEKTSVLNRNNSQYLEAMVLQAEVFSFLAECDKSKGDLKAEFIQLQKAVKIYQSINDDLHLAIIYNRIGDRYLQTGQFTTTLDYADSAIKVAEKSVALIEQANSLKLKADAYAGLGKSQAALEFFKAYKIINDSIYNSSVIQAISNADVLRKTMEKEKDILILSLKLEQDRKLRLVILAIAMTFILMVLVFILILFRRYKKEKQVGLLLKEKNLKISDQANNLEILNQKLLLLNKSKDRFHTIIAHDLKSPVAAFYSIFELLHDSYDSVSEEERKSFIEMAYKEVERLMKLLDNLLTWSRIQGGHLTISKADFFMDDAIEEIVGSLTNMAELKNISFEMGQIEHLKVNADKEMITAVVRNLCTNAVKFTRSGQKIKIGMNRSNDILEVWVRDHGIGIPKNKLQGLFEIDSQIQRNGTNNEPGTGLGLQLCYEFIQLHNGKITVESEEGKGSCFTFEIPFEGIGN